MAIRYALTLWRMKETSTSGHYYQLLLAQTRLSRKDVSPAAYRASRPSYFFQLLGPAISYAPQPPKKHTSHSAAVRCFWHKCSLPENPLCRIADTARPIRDSSPSPRNAPPFSRLLPAIPPPVPFCVTVRYVGAIPLRLCPVSRPAAQVSPTFASSRFTACSSGVMYTVCWWV